MNGLEGSHYCYHCPIRLDQFEFLFLTEKTLWQWYAGPLYRLDPWQFTLTVRSLGNLAVVMKRRWAGPRSDRGGG